jgi:hypothetical protein
MMSVITGGLHRCACRSRSQFTGPFLDLAVVILPYFWIVFWPLFAENFMPTMDVYRELLCWQERYELN